jgi:transglutaminase-like putative cysteine protease
LNHLNKQRAVFVFIIVLSLLSPLVYGKEPTQYVYTLSYSFENKGNTSIALTQDDVSVPLFMNTSWQTVKLEEASHNYDVQIIDSDGNPAAIMGINRELTPGQEESFNASFKIFSSDKPKPSYDTVDAQGFDKIPENLIEQYSVSTETFPCDDPMYYQIASKIIANEDTVLGTVSALVEYVMDNTTYCSFDVPQYPNATFKDHLGDCDDQSILLITMLRSLKIPAYMQVGIYIHSAIDEHDTSWNGHLTNIEKGVGWHGWTMVYIPPWGWVPVDLTLTNAESGLKLIENAPEYGTNIIPALNISTQPYIGSTVGTKTRVESSSLFVTVTDEAHVVYSADNPLQNYVLLGLGAALLVAIGLMFRSSNKT